MNTAHANRLPSAIAKKEEILQRLRQGRPAIFLDFDGTLAPIVEDPGQALLPEETRRMLRELAEHWNVAVISGRALQDLKQRVGIDDLVYAGSHGFELAGPKASLQEQRGEAFLQALDSAEEALRQVSQEFQGVRLERKPYAIAVHFRQAEARIVGDLERQVDRVAARHSDLVRTEGKKIFELRPNIDWNKGRALLYLLDKMHLDGSRTVPFYMGDDTTDEDAFQAIADRGIAIRVGEPDHPTAARYVVRDPAEAAQILRELVQLAAKESSPHIWSLVYEGYDPASEKLREALCTLGNGYFATRGAAPESSAGEVHYPGTYVAGLYNRLVSHVAGKTIENESLVNVPNWLPLTFRIEGGEWFALASVDVLEYRQELDMLQGVLVRTVLFEDRRKRRTRLVQRRFVHMHQPHLAGLETVILPENWSGNLQLRAALDGRVANDQIERYRQLEKHHLTFLESGAEENIIWLQVETNQSHIRIAEAARLEIFYEGRAVEAPRQLIKEQGYIAQEVNWRVEQGRALTIAKIVSLYTSRDAGISEGLIEARAALRHAGTFTGLLQRQALSWRHLWERWRIEVHGPGARTGKILNLHIFHLLQTVSPNTVDLDVGVPPRGLHGEAYRGLIMWDELFIFPLLNLRIPDITRGLLKYRYHRLPHAIWAAQRAGYKGAMFPWQSGSDGEERAQVLHLNPASGRWIPDNSRLQRHINIAVAYNVWQYYQVTGDLDFLSFYGAELFIHIARFWASVASYNPAVQRYDICGVMGPDEFHDHYPDRAEPGIDNNAYTNLMAAWIFWRLDEMLSILPLQRRRFILEDLAVDQSELDRWNEIGRGLRIPFHDGEIISQFEGYGELKEFEWQAYRKKYGNLQRLDRILEAEEESANRYKVSKQADVLMLFYLLSAEELRELFDRLGYRFDPQMIPRNVDYYLKRTSHGSTLSRVVHAWVLSRTNRQVSWRLFQDALESDVEDIQGGTTHEGIHLGAMAGTVDLIMRCYSGLENRGGLLIFNPRLPSELEEIRFSIIYRRNWLDVKITRSRIDLQSRRDNAGPVAIGLGERNIQLSPGESRHFAL